jgi:polysaccharide export outer membrane protein
MIANNGGRMKGLDLRAYLIPVACILLSACATKATVISSGDRYIAPTAVEAYKLGSGDRVRVTVFREPTLSGEFQISAQGKLPLSVAGEIDVGGLTTEQVARAAEAKLAGGFLRDPRVSVEVLAYRPYFILGEVGQSGQYPYIPGLTVTSAVATARGYTPRSQQQVIYIRREGEAVEIAYRMTPQLRIYPGDTIRVAERWF